MVLFCDDVMVGIQTDLVSIQVPQLNLIVKFYIRASFVLYYSSIS